MEISISVAQSASITNSLRDPDWFCEHILRSPNYPWQSDFMNAIADLGRAKRGEPVLINHGLKHRFTVRAGHGKGKTHCLAKIAFWWLFTRTGRVPCTAPKEAQLKTRLWPEMRKLRAGAIQDFQNLVTINQLSLSVAGDIDWCALAETASQPDNLSGHHDPWLLVIVDEASGVDQKFIEVVEGAITDPDNVLILSGNTTQVTGEFYASHMREKVAQLYHRVHVKWEEEPTHMRRWGEEMISKYGLASPVVKVRLFGEFVDMQEGQLISAAWINAARDRKWQEEGSFPRLRVSCDVADGGEDETVVTVGQLYDTVTRMLKQYRFSFAAHVSPIETANAVERIFVECGGNPKKGDDIVIDAGGAGSGAAGYLMKRGLPVIAHMGGTSADDPKKWRNRRVQNYIVMRDAFRDGAVYIDQDFCDDTTWDDFFIPQMTSVLTKPGSERLEDLETKLDMKRRGLKSPDMADSLAMMFSGLRPVIARADGALSVFTVPGVGARQAQEVW